MASISDLPIEILLKIFQFYMQTESQKKFLNNVGKVCKAWNNIALDGSLWRKYDGTPTFKTMMYLNRKGALQNTKELVLSSMDSFKRAAKEIEQRNITNAVNTVENTKKLKISSSNSLESILNQAEFFQNVQNVEIISFSLVRQISNEMLSMVATNCTKLREIKIGKRRKVLTALNYEMLGDFLSVRGCGIKEIDITFCAMPYFSMCVRCISDCCPNLEYLYLENIACPHGVFPTSYVQMHCSKLKALYMDCNIRIGNTRHPSGFPNLEHFVYSGDEIYDGVFESVLFNSPKLKVLSLTECPISASVMLSLPACSLECLSLPQSKACREASLADVLKKWSHSLREVDLSYGNWHVQRAVFKLIQTPLESPLECLNLNFTPVMPELVESIIKDCAHLQTLKLKGCRNLLRGTKRIYRSQLEFQELTKRISSFRSTHPPPQVCAINDL